VSLHGLERFVLPNVRTRVGLVTLAVLVTFAVLTGLRGLLWWPVESSPIDVKLADIASIRIQPVPEGPTFLWTNPPTSPPNERSALIEAAIPIPLPGPEVQPLWCTEGGNLIVNLRDGRTITYGPCRHPQPIRALWATIDRVEANGRCTEPCAPTE
jgi:hypothetical protein